MNSEQQLALSRDNASLDLLVFDAHCYLDTLSGLIAGLDKRPPLSALMTKGVDQVGRALFDALIMLFCTLFDQAGDTTSIPNFVERCRRSGLTDEYVDALALVQVENSDVLERLRKLRNKRVAHRTREGERLQFHEHNGVHVDEMRQILNAVSQARTDLCGYHAMPIPLTGVGSYFADAGAAMAAAFAAHRN